MIRYQRFLETRVLRELAERPAVFLNGPRQAGKTTLAREIAAKHLNADYVTFDNASTQAAAERDTTGFLRSFTRPVVIDEVQLVPEIFRALKLSIDEQRERSGEAGHGRFLLTGSANVLAIPALSDALVGRVSILALYPLSAVETLGHGKPTINGLFDQEIGYERNKGEQVAVAELIRQTTYPEIVADRSIKSDSWFESYLTTLLQRDIRNLAEIEKASVLPSALTVLGARAGGLLNDADAARDTGLNAMTYRRYRALLQQIFLITLLPPWYRNIGKRLVKSPKLYFTDTALLCHQLGVSPVTLKGQNPNLFGRILENFVASELIKQLTALLDGTLHHFRTQDGKEVDFVIERKNGRILGIEVKGTEKISETDFSGLKALRDHIGTDFARGIVLYLGAEILSFADNLVAMPIDMLWKFNMDVTADKDMRVVSGDVLFWADYGTRTKVRCRVTQETIEDYFLDRASSRQAIEAVKRHWSTIWPTFERKIVGGQIDLIDDDHGPNFIAGRHQKIREVTLDAGDFNYRDFRKAKQ
jgi:predicted AAA+ superfamily ATPase